LNDRYSPGWWVIRVVDVIVSGVRELARRLGSAGILDYLETVLKSEWTEIPNTYYGK
jgi:hypothetical protein